MSPGLKRLFELHVAGSVDKQLQLAELISDHDWQLDIDRGKINFGELGPWRIQVLGLASKRTGTWLWSWAIQTIEIPPGLLKVVTALQRLGDLKDIPEFVNFELPNGEQIGTRLALTTTGMFKADAFYRAPYSGGALYLLLADPIYPREPVNPAVRIPKVLPQVFQRFKDLDHRQVLDGYLMYYGLTAVPERSDVVIENGTEPILRAHFDERDQLTSMDTLVESA
jgi:hypothetical protein